MLSITIICVGKLKEAFYLSASEEYIKRLKAFCKLEIIEINAVSLPDEPNFSQISSALSQEGERILKKVPKNTKTIALCIEGTQHTSQELAGKLDNMMQNSVSSIAFLIGSSYGLSEKVKNNADESISMSKMTFNHRLARIMLLEQIYRAFQINSGGKYHK